MYKDALGFIAIFLTIVAFLPYIKSILNGKTKPHVFSWVIWGSTTLIVFAAQLSDNAGAGAWPFGISGIITIYVAFLAYMKKSDITITYSDWIFFIIAMSSIPVWYITSSPLWTVIVLTAIDIIGFAPTFRKAYYNPFEENLTFFVIMGIRNLISTFAIVNYSIITTLFPAFMTLACAILVPMIIWRRNIIDSHIVR
ncbi:hypothetical protein N9W34_06020 [Rickettsiales bacterium]|nr:hypothetical protein [Rickettsiales bacterium]